MEAKRDQNRVTALLGVSSSDAVTPIALQVDPSTGRLLVDVNSGSGTGIVEGDKTSNGAAPGTDNVGVLPAVATNAAPTYTEGRMVALSTDLTGALRITGSISVGGFQDDSAFTPGTSTGNVLMGFFDDVSPDSVDEGDGGAVRMSGRRELYVQLRDAAGGERGLNIDSSNRIGVVPVGSVAHDAAGTGVNPMLVGGYASAAAPTDVSADGDSVRAWYLRNGAQATVVTAAGALIGGDATNGLDVDVTRLIPGVTATALGKAEDAAHTTGDTGVMSLAVRQDTLAALATTTGDYIPLSTDSLGALWTRDTSLLVDDAAFTPGTSRVMPVGLQADETSTDSVDEGDIGAPRMTLDRKQIVTPQSHTNGGATPYKLVSAASTNATSVKASAGQIYSLAVFNINAAVRYLKLYNKASAPTVGTDTPVHTFAIPGATTGGGFTLSIPVGMEFTTGIAFAITTGMADSDTGAVAATEILVNMDYK